MVAHVASNETVARACRRGAGAGREGRAHGDRRRRQRRAQQSRAAHRRARRCAGRARAERRRGAADLEALVQSLADKIEQIQQSRGDNVAFGHLEDRIVKLVERLDASDSRLGHLEAIERGLADLLVHIEDMRANKDAGGLRARQLARRRRAQARHRPHPGCARSGARHARPCRRPPGHDRKGHSRRARARRRAEPTTMPPSSASRSARSPARVGQRCAAGQPAAAAPPSPPRQPRRRSRTAAARAPSACRRPQPAADRSRSAARSAARARLRAAAAARQSGRAHRRLGSRPRRRPARRRRPGGKSELHRRRPPRRPGRGAGRRAPRAPRAEADRGATSPSAVAARQADEAGQIAVHRGQHHRHRGRLDPDRRQCVRSRQSPTTKTARSSRHRTPIETETAAHERRAEPTASVADNPLAAAEAAGSAGRWRSPSGSTVDRHHAAARI